MNRFPRYNGQEEESKLKVIAKHKCILKHGYWKAKSAMFKDDMLPLLKTRENFFLTFPVKILTSPGKPTQFPLHFLTSLKRWENNS